VIDFHEFPEIVRLSMSTAMMRYSLVYQVEHSLLYLALSVSKLVEDCMKMFISFTAGLFEAIDSKLGVA